MNITTALKLLDPRDDEHWTTDGSPRLDVLSDLLAAKVTRKQVTDAAPNFTREFSLAELTKEEADLNDDPDPADPTDTVDTAPDDFLSKTTDEEPAKLDDVPPPEPVPTTELGILESRRGQLTDEMNLASAKLTAAKDLFDAAAAAVNDMNRRIERMVKTDPNHATKGVRDYIAKSNATREDKARKLQAFTDMVEASPDELAKKLGLRSPLDNALRGRKTPRALMNR